MPAPDPDTRAHLEWLGFLQPKGLVVSAPALAKAGAILNRQDTEGWSRLLGCIREREIDPARGPEPCIPDFRGFAAAVLGWGFSPLGYAGTEEAPIPTALEVPLPDYGEVLRPALAVRERDPRDGRPPWQLLVQVLEPGQDFDAPATASSGASSSGGSAAASSGTPSRTASPVASSPGNGSATASPGAPSSPSAAASTTAPSRTGASGNAGGGAASPGTGLRRLDASPQGRAERLLRSTGVPAGLLFNGIALRLISAPRGESSGWMDFRVADMSTTAGRPLCSALRLLLSEQRLLALPRGQRLAALLEDSRKYQNEVSERLSEQVLHALYELVRGLQAAHDASGGELLREPLSPGGDRDDVYRALLSVILRLVFLLYAEERGALPEDDTFLRHYSLTGLYEGLREDAALHPDTMDQRFGAWAQLLVLFRLIHDGAPAHRTGGALTLPERRGALFDPDRFPFLEGRYAGAGVRQIVERVRPPLVSDGAVYRVLEKLLVLDGERISYRTLDVEQIGSVYETIMGFRMEVATGRSVAVRPAKKLGAPNVVDLDALLAEPKGGRARWLQTRADRNLTDTVAKGLRAAETVDDLHAALDRVLDKDAAPDLVPPGALVLQPNEERRRSGSHYTPRELTEPIVRHTLAPLLDRLRGEDGRAPAPERILDLKVCDPALGSGAFLVEACRQLGDALVESWRAHDAVPEIPPDENEVVFARRQVARRCLYGVDRNPVALDLAKLSLWLITLAKEHPLTFLDHALLHGDSLVGLTRTQIEAFHWKGDAPRFQAGFEVMRIREHLAKIAALRQRIRAAGEEVSDRERRLCWREVKDELDEAAVFGDLVLAAFFEKAKPREREALRAQIADALVRGEMHQYRSWIEELRDGEPPLAPFHWEIEFPEVFERETPGFDAVVGNPPFAGKNTVAAANAARYPDWLKQTHAENHGNADLVAHFFRRAFGLVRRDGAFGLIATNTIAQGDTRSTGLRWICEHGGEIYRARRRVKWPGLAAVVVSVLHVAKGRFPGANARRLDGEAVPAHGAETSSAGFFSGAKRYDGEAAPDHGAGISPAGFFPGAKRHDGEAAPDHGAGASSAGFFSGAKHLDGEAAPAHGAEASSAGLFPGAKRHDGEAASAHGAGTSPAGFFSGAKYLDGEAVETITAFLFHRGGHGDPERLAANAGRSFQGSIVLGMGFTFDDTDKKGVASPLAEMRRLIEDNPRNRQAIFPYIGGEEVNTSPTHAHHRYVINFRDWPLRREEVGEAGDFGDSEEVREARDPGEAEKARELWDPEDLWAGTDDQQRRYPLRRENSGESREGIREARAEVDGERHRYPLRREGDGESEDIGQSWTDAGDRRHRYPLRREDGRESEGIGESWMDAGDQRSQYSLRREGGGESEGIGESWMDAGDQRSRYSLWREGGGESEGIGESWADAGDERRRYPLHREDNGESWADADEKRRRELRRQPIVPHDYPEPVAADWPELLVIVEERVRGRRGNHSTAPWWQFERLRPELFAAVAGLERILAINCGATPHHAFALLSSRMVFANTLAVLPLDTHSAFCALQSRPHEIWARFFGSSLEDRLRYTPSDCFETFPFPENWETHPALEAVGKAYHDFRAALMVQNGEGMTKTYNRFHDPDETDPDIAKLRALHAAMDRDVLAAYGWNDIPTDCEFLLDYEIDEDEWGGKKKPYRYRWPDATRDEVLARLLELNADRAAEEVRTGAASRAKLPPDNSRPRPQRPQRRAARSRSRPVLATNRTVRFCST